MTTNTSSFSFGHVLGAGRGRLLQRNNFFQPARRPGTANTTTSPAEVTQPSPTPRRPVAVCPVSSDQNAACQSVGQRGSQDVRPKTSDSQQACSRPKIKLLAKYSYKANPDKPGGFTELDMKQGQTLTLVNKHETNEHWWNVQDENGCQGYVPASYLKVLEDKPSTLPWLQKTGEEEKGTQGTNVFGSPGKSAFVPYKSAYTKTGDLARSAAGDKYYCDVCEKSFNGPKPYSSHMASRAHREEVELAAERS